MATCTFFGHRHCPQRIKELIKIHLIGLIENENTDNFYVGNQGDFDRYVLEVLRELSVEYPHIRYAVVLAYHPALRRYSGARADETIFPIELENSYPRFAIEKRNNWMLDRSDKVLSYAVIDGGAMKFTKRAERQGKTIINLGDLLE